MSPLFLENYPKNTKQILNIFFNLTNNKKEKIFNDNINLQFFSI